jgi:opacity protein-like surface antigen
MVRRIVAGLLGIGLVTVPLSAQKVEISFNGGYTASEGIAMQDRALLGVIYNKADVVSSGSYNFTAGGFVNERMLIEFLYGRQMTKLRAVGPTAELDVADQNVDNYHVNFVYHWLLKDGRVRPFAFGGLGATHYGFGDITVAGTPSGTTIAGNTQFSTTWGAGVKFYASPNVGVKFTTRWTPTYIKSDPAGYWCDPWYGCWLVGDPDYSHQFDISGGITVMF